MSLSHRRKLSTALVLALLTLGLAGCATNAPEPPPPPPPPVVPTLPPAFPSQDIVGRWGLAAYHKDEDRARTEAAAANQCRQPYIIVLGTTGGVMMHLADQATPTELRLKGAPDNKTFIGPEGEPPGSIQDREVVQFDGINFKATNNIQFPSPLQKPHPPIWCGGNGEIAMRRAAQRCDGWTPFFLPPGPVGCCAWTS